MSIDALGTITVVHMKNLDNSIWYNLSIVSKLGSDRYSMVKLVHIVPAYIIVNKVGRMFSVKGSLEDKGQATSCSPDCNTPFHFDPDAIKKIQIRMSENDSWSANLDFGSVGKLYCRIEENSAEILLRVELSLDSGSCFVFIEEAKSWPFVIENHSDYVVSCNQTGVSVCREVASHNSINYAWDEPSGKHRSLDLVIHGRKKEININEIGQRAPFPFRLPDNTKHYVSIDVVASGPVIKLKIANFVSNASASKGGKEKKSQNAYRRSPAAHSKESMSSPSLSNVDSEKSDEGYEVVEVNEEVFMVTVVKLPFVGLSIVRKDNKELLYLCCKGIELRLSRSNLYITYGLQIKSIQLDNQMFDWQVPIILFPAYSPIHGNTEQQAAQQQQQQQQNHLRIALIKSTDATHGVDCYNYFGFLLQETIIELGTDIIKRVNDFLSFDLPTSSSSSRLIISESSLAVPVPPVRDPSKDVVYFELFQIHPIKLTVSSTKTEGIMDEAGDGGGGFVNPFFAIQDAAISAFANFSQAPLTFNALILEHPIVSLSRLKQLVYNHYMSGVSGQIAKLVGSADFIFNPVGLFNNLGSGVSDFFYEPYLGFVSDRPQDIGIGFLKGGFSLVRKTVYGLTDSFSKFTGSIGKGLSALTFDKSFQQRRRLDRARNRPRHALFGVVTGARQLIEGVAGGIGGLVEKPLEGAKEEGAEGFFKGIAIGLAGALSKPFVGAVDMVTSVTEGIRNSADPNVQDLQQVRLARVIPYDGIVKKYRERDARGQSILYNCIGPDIFKEFYMGHLEDEEGSALFITCRRILACRVQSGRLIWEAPFDVVTSVRTDSESIIITLNVPENRQRRITCSKREVQEWFIERVNISMAIFGESNR